MPEPQQAEVLPTPLERAHFSGTIHVVTSLEALDVAYETLVIFPVLGLDTQIDLCLSYSLQLPMKHGLSELRS